MPNQVASLLNRCKFAALGELPWDALLRDIGEWVGGSKAKILGLSESSSYGASLNWNHDPSAIARYNEHYHRNDPRAHLSRLTQVHGCQLGQQYVRNETIAKTEYFDAISLHGDVCDSVHGIISDDAEIGRQAISIQRGFDEDFFTSAEAAKLSALLPVFDDALRSSVRTQRIAGKQQFGDTLAYALLDRALNAEFFAGCGLEQLGTSSLPVSVAGGKLTFANKRQTRVVSLGIEHALAGQNSTFAIGNLQLSFSPLPPSLAWIGPRDCVLLALYPRRASGNQKSELFAAAHDFTIRESEILNVLIKQTDMRAAAAEIGIGYETLSWHVKNMCLKSGHSRRESMVLAASRGALSL